MEDEGGSATSGEALLARPPRPRRRRRRSLIPQYREPFPQVGSCVTSRQTTKRSAASSLPPSHPPDPCISFHATMRHTTLAYLVISYLKHCTRIARARAHNWSCVAKTLECREPPLRGAPVLLPIDGLRRVDVDEGGGGRGDYYGRIFYLDGL